MSDKYTPETVGEPMFELVPVRIKETGYTFDEVIVMLGRTKEIISKVRIERPNVTTVSVVIEDRVVAKYVEESRDQWFMKASPVFATVLLHCLAKIEK